MIDNKNHYIQMNITCCYCIATCSYIALFFTTVTNFLTLYSICWKRTFLYIQANILYYQINKYSQSVLKCFKKIHIKRKFPFPSFFQSHNAPKICIRRCCKKKYSDDIHIIVMNIVMIYTLNNLEMSILIITCIKILFREFD